MKISFTRDGWEDYPSWANQRTILTRINRMIEEAAPDPATGIGKPERLSHHLSVSLTVPSKIALSGCAGQRER